MVINFNRFEILLDIRDTREQDWFTDDINGHEMTQSYSVLH